MDIKDSYLHGTTGVVKAISVDADNNIKYTLADVAGTIKTVNQNLVTTTNAGQVPKADVAAGTIDSSSNDWVLTNNNGSIGWYKLPAAAFYYRPVQVNGTSILGSNNTALNLIPGSNINITNSGGNVTISSPNNTTISQAIPYITGSSTDAAGAWTGSHAGIIEYTEGLTIMYVPAVAGTTPTTLNINGLGAKTCYTNNATKLTTHYSVGTPILFTYVGGNWKRADYDSTMYTSAYSNTSAATETKAATCSGYVLKNQSYIHITMRYSNTTQRALTLNIANTGAKPIYINGVASSASNYTLPAGTYIIYYDGTNYYFRTDGILPGKIEKATLTDTITCQQGGSDTYRPIVVTPGDNSVYYNNLVTANYATGDLKATSFTGTFKGTADKVSNDLVIKIKSGTTEGTDLYTYNGSASKTLDIKQGSGITLTAAANSLTITNAGVRSIATGTANGTISVNTNGTSANVAVKGLGTAAYMSSASLMSYSNFANYVAARLSADLSSKAHETYIEYWSSPGWFNSKWGWIEAVDGFKGNLTGNVTGNLTGNADTATKLATVRTISLTGSVTGSGSFDGSGDLSIVTTTNHIHPNHLTTTVYNYTNGCLVKTSIPTKRDAMTTFRIEGNAYGGNKAILTIGNFYNYNSGDKIININATHLGYDFGDISIFCYDGFVHLWFKQLLSFQSFTVYVYTTNVSPYEINKITSITNEAMPTSGVTRLNTITPVLNIDSLNIGSQSVQSAVSATTATKLKTARTLWGQSFNGSANVSGDMTGVGNITINATSNTDYFINFLYNSTPTYSWRLGYLGSGSDDANYFVLQSSKASGGNWHNAVQFGNETLNALFAGTVTAPSFVGPLTGNADTATKLATARTIWGQSFDGSANISGDMTGVGVINTILNLTTKSGNASVYLETSTATVDYAHIYVTNKTDKVNVTRPLVLQNGFGNVGIGVIQPTQKLEVSGNVKATSFLGNLDGSYINALTGYSKATTKAAIAVTDTLNTALGKLEFKADAVYDLVKGAYDGDGAIENLAEILKVLEGIKDTDTIQAIVGKYLPLTGGTITGEVEDPLRIKTSSNRYSTIQFRTANNHFIRFGFCYVEGNTVPRLFITGHDAWSTEYPILHTGNSYIKNGVITINGTSITPLTAHQSLANYVTLDTAQTITGAKTFDANVKMKAGVNLNGSVDYSGLQDASYQFGLTEGLIHLRIDNSNNYWGNAITWSYSSSNNAQAGIYVTTGGSYGSEMWLATTDRFSDGPKASLKIDSKGNIYGIRGPFKGTFVSKGGTSSQFVKGDGSLDSTTYATSASLGNYLPLTGGTLTGKLTIEKDAFGMLVLYRKNSTNSATIQFKNGNDVSLGYFGINTADSALRRFSADATASYKIWDEGTDGSGSGLDADLLDGTHKSGLLTGMYNVDTTDNPKSIAVTVGGTTKYLKVNHAVNSQVLQSTRYNSDDPTPNTTVGVTFQFSNLSSLSLHNVLTMKSYSDSNYVCSQLATPANNPGADTGYTGTMKWRQGRNTTWSSWKTIIDSDNYSSYLPFLNSSTVHATNSSVIYAPNSAGTSGQILTSSGGTPTWSNPSSLTVGTASNGIYYIEGTGSTAGTWLGEHAGITSYYKGLTIAYKIAIAGASTTTLNINNLGAKTCYVNTSKITTHYGVGATILLVYDGTYFRTTEYWTSDTYCDCYCGTGAGTAAKTATSSYYTLRTGNLFVCTIRYTNTLAGALTLNVNSTGAKPIYLDGTATSSTNYNLTAGKYLVYYDGTNYYFYTNGAKIPNVYGTASNATKFNNLSTTDFVRDYGSVNTLDMDTIKKEGFYYGYNMTNSAATLISNFIVSNYSNDWGSQLQLCPQNGRTYVRFWRDSGGVMQPWKEFAYLSDLPTTLPNPYTLTLQAGTFAAKTYDGSAAVTVNIPTSTSHLTNDSGFLTSRGYIGKTAVQASSADQALTGITNITMSGDITINAANTDKFLNFFYNASGASYSFRLGYLGTGSSDTNYLVIQGTTSGTDWSNALRIGCLTLDAAFGGNVYPLVTNTKTLGTSSLRWSNLYSVLGNFSGDISLSNGTATSPKLILQRGGTADGYLDYSIFANSSAKLEISAYASDAGTKTVATIDSSGNYSGNAATATALKSTTAVSSKAYSLSSAAWTDTGYTFASLETGTYAIQITSGSNLVASGVMSVYTNISDTIGDEIPLHVYGTASWRPYLRTYSNKLQISSNDASSTSRTVTIKIAKLL